MLEKIDFNKYIAKGLKISKEKPLEKIRHIQKWVKQKVSVMEWKNYYSQLSSYCFLEKKEDGVWVGFMAADFIPINCIECSDDEIMRIDAYRRAYNIRPFPTTELT